MNQIAISIFAHPDGIGRMMASDCSKALMAIGFLRFEISQGGGRDVPHTSHWSLLSDFHLSKFTTIFQNFFGSQSLPVQGILFCCSTALQVFSRVFSLVLKRVYS